MSLENKFLELAFAKITSEELAEQCVQICDEERVKFGDWLLKNYDGKSITTELLEIYKQGL